MGACVRVCVCVCVSILLCVVVIDCVNNVAEQSRVILSEQFHRPLSSYINANYVRVSYLYQMEFSI